MRGTSVSALALRFTHWNTSRVEVIFSFYHDGLLIPSKGANDVANSFATSVASRSLTLKQAMCIASVMEFAGALLVGSRVTDTIRTKVISISLFESDPSVLMQVFPAATL